MNAPLAKQKNTTLITYSLLWLIAVGIGTYFRLYPLLNFTPEEASEKATVFLIAQLRAKIAQQVEFNYYNLPREQKQLIAKKLFDELLHKEGPQAREAIQKLSKQIKSDFGQSKNYPYLMESDSFYYYELTENIIKNGNISDSFKGSKFLHKRMLAPLGHWVPITLHPFIGFFIHQIIRLFSPSIDLMFSVSFTPIVVSALALIPFFWIGLQLGCRPVVNLAAAIFFLLAPIFIKRSLFGWYDNDPYNIFFPLLILASIFYAVEHMHEKQKARLAAAGCALFIVLYNFFWQGWVFTFSVIFSSLLVCLLYNRFWLKHRWEQRELASVLGIFSGTCFVVLSFILGLKEFFVLFQEGWVALKGFMFPQLSAWPDIFISVGELRKITFQEIADYVGYRFFFYLAFFGLLISFAKLLKRDRSAKPYHLIILSVFFATSFFMSLGAMRFVLLCLIPMALFFCLGLEAISRYLERQCSLAFRNKGRYYNICSFVLGGFVLCLTILPIHSTRN